MDIEPEEQVDLNNMEVDPDAILSLHELPAHGLAAMEKSGQLFHVVNAGAQTGDDLAHSFGHDKTLHVDASNWNLENLEDQIEILNRANQKPCRIVFSNLGEFRHQDAAVLEDFIKRYTADKVSSMFFVHDESGHTIPDTVMRKVLMQAQLCDANVLLEAITHGW